MGSNLLHFTEAELLEEETRRIVSALPTAQEIEEELFFRELEGLVQKAPMGDLDDLPGLSRIASRLEPKARQAFLQAVTSAEQRVNLDALAQAIQSGQITRIEAEAQLEFYKSQLGDLGVPIQDGFLRGAEFANSQLRLSAGESLRFDLVNPHAVAFSNRHIPQLVGGLTSRAQENIQAALSRASSGAITMEGAAREMRDSLGLLPRDMKFLDKFKTNLLERGIGEEAIARRASRLRESLLRRRSLVIARTELITAANAGQQSLWMEGMTQGLLDKQTMVRRWVVTHDDRLDVVICEPLDGVETSLDAPFVHPVTGTEYMYPAAHPQCRCAIVLARSSRVIEDEESISLPPEPPPTENFVPSEERTWRMNELFDEEEENLEELLGDAFEDDFSESVDEVDRSFVSTARDVGRRLSQSGIDEASAKSFVADLRGRALPDDVSVTPYEELSLRMSGRWGRVTAPLDPPSIAHQLAVQEQLGRTATVTEHLSSGNAELAEAFKKGEALYKKHKSTLKAYVQAQYEQTQAYLQSQGIDRVSVFRGMTVHDRELLKQIPVGELSKLDTAAQPLSSWTTSIETADNFTRFESTTKGVLLARDIPASEVYGVHMSGMGTILEKEVVVLGGQQSVYAGRFAHEATSDAVETVRLLLSTLGQ